MAANVPRGLDPEGVRIALGGGKHWGPNDQARYDAWARSRGKSTGGGGGNPWPSGLDPNLARQALGGGSHWGPNDQARYNALVRQRQQNNRPAPSPSPRPAPSGGGGSYGTRAKNIPAGLDPNLVRQALGGGTSWGPNDQARYNALVRQRQQNNRGPSPSPSPSGGGGSYGTRATNIPAGLDPALVRAALGGGGHWGPNDQKRYDALVRARGGNSGPSPSPSSGSSSNEYGVKATNVPSGLNPELVRKALGGGGHWGPNDQKRYDALVREQGGGSPSPSPSSPSPSGSSGSLLSQNTINEVSQGIGTMFQGQSWGNSLMQDLFTNGGTEDDDGRRAMRDAFQFDVASKFFNTQLGMAQSEFNLAQNKEGMSFANNLDRQTGQEARAHIHSLNMMQMDKQYQLNNQFAQHDFNRNIGMLGAQGEQVRKNYAAKGEQDRLMAITTGEQQRLNYAAEGDQNRLNTITTAEQIRQNIAAQGDQDRRNTVTQGEQQRLNYAAQGVEQRKNIAATGVENRLQAATEGEQQRLNIGKTANEERSTMTHSDNLMARREKRQNARARANVRDF